MKTLIDLPDVNGKTIFVRVDFNVLVTNGVVTDDFRIKKSFHTIDELRKRGARLILGSHIEGTSDTLAPVFDYLKNIYPVVFVPDYFPETPVSISESLDAGKIVLLENLRKYPGEKANDADFAKHLASFADYYVNEAFPAAHRAHASVVGVPTFISGFAGYTFEEEIREISRAFHPDHPFFFVLGGAKFETKFPLAKKFFSVADSVFIGGALANDFLKAKGFVTGKSLLSQGNFDLSSFLTDKLILPTDVVVTGANGTQTKRVEDVSAEDTIVDVGPETIQNVALRMHGTKFVLWNGPLGNYENGFKSGTEGLAQIVASGSTTSIVGGGDTVASIASLNLSDKFTFLSTGGGAMLEFLADETLPGIEALNAS